ncbi:MAG: succinate dehydrogenase / fumarate reductase cytochrome b subunit [Rickettsiales bacterium]|jgi:succinate dehydrogenase / fumarate reductase cytochrome b subunit
MNKKNPQERPLSPHIQIYKPQIGSLTSILHRLTGIFLYFGVVAISWAIIYYAYQVEIVINGEMIDGQSCSCTLKYVFYAAVFAWAFSLYYHLCNGIRHLFWDIGKGFDKETSIRNGILVLATSALLTVLTAYLAFLSTSQLN